MFGIVETLWWKGKCEQLEMAVMSMIYEARLWSRIEAYNGIGSMVSIRLFLGNSIILPTRPLVLGYS